MVYTMMMIDYIKMENYKLHVVQAHNLYMYDCAFSTWIYAYLKYRYLTLKALERRTRINHQFKRRIPLYINEDMILLCIHSHRSDHLFYINYCQIISWTVSDKKAIIEFKTGHCMVIDSYQIFIKQIHKVEQMTREKDDSVNYHR